MSIDALNGDPEKCVLWAAAAIAAYREATHCELEDALHDLLADLMHWADARGFVFENALWLAREHYADEGGTP